MTKKTVFITGMSGYLGSCLCRELDRTDWCEKFYGIDIRPPLNKYVKGTFKKIDINENSLIEWVKEIRPDIIVHLAFIVDPIHNNKLQNKVNVGGTKNVLRAVKEANVSHILVTSSGTAYGAWPDNPVPLKESHPIRQHPDYQYAKDKAEQEKICQNFAQENPEIKLSIIRPCVVYGPRVDNYLSDLLTMPVSFALKEYNPPLQFVHEDDVVRSIITIIENSAAGPFNIAPPDTIPIHEALKMANKLFVLLPDYILTPVLSFSWHMQIPFYKIPPSFMDYIKYPWVLDSSHIQNELNFKFMYSSKETLEILLRSKKII